ncbi:hypothetical protein HPB52_002183 [Rhipicephalus sanguineus]|uniref:Sodium-dependent multivitamin transporter n=1 Tax=Rhipicephalus sanguineus TaxID=34632 RepID=A0A9D4PD55_RHISA|nr:hypothetical protein HPB52_002183 [Rhipicephalus sanguineus]
MDNLHVGDIVIFIVLTAAGYIVGLYFSFSRTCCQAATSDGGAPSAVLETFLGGRTLPGVALAVSVLASVANAVGVVSFVGHYYVYGFNHFWALTGIPLAAAAVSLVFIPLLYNMRVASVFEVNTESICFSLRFVLCCYGCSS